MISQLNDPIVYSLRDELIGRGYNYKILTAAGEKYKQFIAPNGWVWLTRNNFYDYPFISLTARLVSREKSLGYLYAAHYNVNVADFVSTENIEEATRFLNTHQKVVVKPGDGSGGDRVVTGISDTNILVSALKHARSSDGAPPIVQAHYEGDEVRMTIINGVVTSSIWRQTPRVVGDGVLTVAELIKRENDERAQLVFPTLSYPLLDESNTINIDRRLIPKKDETVILGQASMISKGASFIGVSEQLHDSYKNIACKLAASLNPSMLVVDLLIQDMKKPATNNNYTFLEFNTSPSIRGYTSIRHGDRPDVARVFADMIDSMANKELLY